VQKKCARIMRRGRGRKVEIKDHDMALVVCILFYCGKTDETLKQDWK
jgi:hypothetical protein